MGFGKILGFGQVIWMLKLAKAGLSKGKGSNQFSPLAPSFCCPMENCSVVGADRPNTSASAMTVVSDWRSAGWVFRWLLAM